MADNSCRQFRSLLGRDPTEKEFQELMVTLATSTFVKRLSEDPLQETDEDDSDYDPNAPEELAQFEADQSLPEEINMPTEEPTVEEREEKEISVTPSKKRKPAVAFFSPLKDEANSPPSKNYEAYNKFLLERAVHKFKNTHGRLPTAEEKDKLEKFLAIPATVNFDSDEDEDSDYNPAEVLSSLFLACVYGYVTLGVHRTCIC